MGIAIFGFAVAIFNVTQMSKCVYKIVIFAELRRGNIVQEHFDEIEIIRNWTQIELSCIILV